LGLEAREEENGEESPHPTLGPERVYCFWLWVHRVWVHDEAALLEEWIKFPARRGQETRETLKLKASAQIGHYILNSRAVCRDTVLFCSCTSEVVCELTA